MLIVLTNHSKFSWLDGREWTVTKVKYVPRFPSLERVELVRGPS